MKYVEVILTGADWQEIHWLPENSPHIAHLIEQGGTLNKNPQPRVKEKEKAATRQPSKTPRKKTTWSDFAKVNGL